jgi:hypothetical protein
MRKTLILTLVLCVAASIAYAQTTGTAGGTGSSMGSTTGTTTTTTTTTTKHHGSHNPAVHGSIASVDATAKSFVVHPKKGADVTVKVNDKTHYTPKGKGWDDVKQGDNVSVTYHNDGTDNWAVTVHWPTPKAPKAPKTTGTTGK